MERVYIAGKVTGTDDYMERFSKAEDFLRSKGYDVVNPVRVEAMLPPDSTSYRDYIKVSLVLLDSCQCIYMLSNWLESPGARLEFHYAHALGYKFLYEVGADKGGIYADC